MAAVTARRQLATQTSRTRWSSATSSILFDMTAARGDDAIDGLEVDLEGNVARAVPGPTPQPRAAPVHLSGALVVRREGQLDVVADQFGKLGGRVRKAAVVHAVAADAPEDARRLLTARRFAREQPQRRWIGRPARQRGRLTAEAAAASPYGTASRHRLGSHLCHLRSLRRVGGRRVVPGTLERPIRQPSARR